MTPLVDTKDFITAGQTCSQNKSSHQAHSSHLHPQPCPFLVPRIFGLCYFRTYVFHLHGLHRDIVSDRGPQFTSRLGLVSFLDLGFVVWPLSDLFAY